MDKELLRLVIIAIGAVVIIGMVVWSAVKKKRQNIDFYDKGNPLDKIDRSLILNTEHDDFDIVPLGSALDDEDGDEEVAIQKPIHNTQEMEPMCAEAVEEDTPVPHKPIKKPSQLKEVPELIQFSIIAPDEEGFNGALLVEAFQRLGLEYGSLKIFERLDENNLVDFAVANMVNPGTFPERDLDSFYCPGVVFFFQPHEVDNPAHIFEQFLLTVNLLASDVGGTKLDHNREPLTDETIIALRKQLA